MATDPILNNTLTGTLPAPALPPMPTGLQVPETPQNITNKNIGGAINTLQGAQQSPNSLVDFQRVLANVSRQAYSERQKSETSNLGFNPSDVSGSTFASIISDFESRRGADVGKIYTATTTAYMKSQEIIENKLQFLQGLKQSQDQFKAELKLKKDAMKAEKKLAKQDYKLKMKQLNQAQSNWEREFNKVRFQAQNTVDNQNDTPKWAL